MRCIFNKKFIEKLQIPEYLLGGFYGIFRMTSDIQSNESVDGSDFINGGTSKVFIIDTITNRYEVTRYISELREYHEDASRSNLNDSIINLETAVIPPKKITDVIDEFILSIKLSDRDNLGSMNKWVKSKYTELYLYYIDYFNNPTLRLNDLYSSNDQIPYRIRLDSLAFKLVWNESDMPYEFFNTEIIHIPLKINNKLIRLNASFKCFSQLEHPDMTHYVTSNLGAESYFIADDSQLITKSSGNIMIRRHLVDIDKDTLKGSIKIDTSGLIKF